MVKVKIIVGWYGHKEGLKGVNSTPFFVSEEEAKRLCDKKIAVIVGENEKEQLLSEAEPLEEVEEPAEEQIEEQTEEVKSGYPTDEELNAMNFNALRQCAKGLGLDTTGKLDEIKGRIVAARDEMESMEDEVEELVLEAAEPEG